MLIVSIEFLKLHVCGNDYIFIDLFDQELDEELAKNCAELSKKLSERNFAVGSDGLILIKPSKIADGKMIMWNKDGTEGKMCGNGASCVAKILCEKFKKDTVKIEVPASKKIIKVKNQNGFFITNMGCAVFLNGPKRLCGLDVYPVCLGNDHCVIFAKDLKNVFDLAPKIENHKYFPCKTNVEFVKILSENEIDLRIWEKGSGKTLACGSGTCAAVSMGCKLGYLNENEIIKVNLPKSEAMSKYTKDGVLLFTKPVESYKGQILKKNLV